MIKKRKYYFFLFCSPILLFLSLFVSFHAGSAEVIERVVAVVNDEPITLIELNRESNPLLAAIKDDPEGDAKKEKIKKIEEKVLDDLIDQKLQLQEAKSMGISVGDETVNLAMEDQKKSYGLDDNQFIQSLKQENVTLEDFKERIRQQLTIMSLLNANIKPKVVITSSEIKDYYDKNIDLFSTEGSVTLDQLVIIHDKDEAKSNDAFENKIKEILVKAENGAPLENFEKEYETQFPLIKFQHLGEFKKNELSEDFKDAFNLKSGETMLIKTDKAYHIVKLISRKGASVKPFTVASEEIKDIIFSKKSEKILKNYIESLRNKAYIEKRL